MSASSTNEIQGPDTPRSNLNDRPRLSTETVSDAGTTSKRGTTSIIKILNGDLDIWIHEARCLPNMDLMSERMRRCFTGCQPTCMTPRKHVGGVHNIITSDPYVSVCLSGATVAQTRVIPNSENPKWEEHFVVNVAHPTAMLDFQVKDNDLFGAQLIGIASVPVEKVMRGELVKSWIPLAQQSSEPIKSSESAPELNISLQYKPIEMDSLYGRGIGAGPKYSGVPNAYFPLRKGSKVIEKYESCRTGLPGVWIPNVVMGGAPGTVEDCFKEPQSLECVKRVNEMAEGNWLAYASPEIYMDMQGHLMMYPIRVEKNGKVGPVPGYEMFLDVGGKVLGSQTSLPDVLTT